MSNRILLLAAFTCLSFFCGLFSQYSGTQSPTFDKSPDPYCWFSGYNRKIQFNLDPITGEMISSLYRRSEYGVGGGVIGGMAGEWPYNGDFAALIQSVYIYDPITSQPVPGSRYPFVCEFINGTAFGLFNRFDTITGVEDSFPYCTTGVAGWGWDLTFWNTPEIIAYSDSVISPPSAWKGTGDVVYDPVSEYYYWTTAWREGIDSLSAPVNCVVGRTKTPDIDQDWIWSDHRDLRFDTDNIISKYSDVSLIGPVHIAYAKQIDGNGTGKGIGVAVTQCYPWYAPNLSYFYTANWGGDSLSGSWQQNWNKTSLGFYHQPLNELFDWVGETLTITDSIGFDLNTNTVFADSSVITIDYPRIMWDISVVATENNIVHVLCLVFPASEQYDNCIFPWTDEGYRAGYYDIRGEITDTGVNWMPAVLISNPIHNDRGWKIENSGMEFASGTNRNLSISYAGYDNIIASWLDKPEEREILFDFLDTPKYYNYIDDGYMIVSLDGGNSWQTEKTVEAVPSALNNPPGLLQYAANVTKTNSLVEEGWAISSHGSSTPGHIRAFAGCQYPDITNEIGMTYMDYERFLKAWSIVYLTSGIEEPSTVASDFELYQNYPNPFNPATEIKFSLAEAAKVNLSVYNTNGQLVRTLIDGKTEKGYHTVNFLAEGLNSGVYFCRLDVGGSVRNMKMLLVK